MLMVHIAGTIAWCAVMAAAEGPAGPVLRVPLAPRAVAIDGHIGRAEWEGAAVVRRLWLPGNATALPVPTELLLQYDPANLYLAARCTESEQGYRLHFENDLRHAIDHDELTLSYQPTVSLESGRVIGIEALLRWTHPERGAVGPAEFVPVAEESGLIVPLGSWVLNEAIGQAADWLREVPGHQHFLLSVNISPRQLSSPDLVPLIAGLLERHQWPAHFLALELTENVPMDDVDNSIEVLDALKAIGVRLAIDDFGTGYSSLSYLERFNFDIVKIDQSFVTGLGSTGGGLAITAAVVLMARSLGLVTVAEGIETKGQSAVLQSLGCDWGQGYHFSRPLSAVEAGALLHTAL